MYNKYLTNTCNMAALVILLRKQQEKKSMQFVKIWNAKNTTCVAQCSLNGIETIHQNSKSLAQSM